MIRPSVIHSDNVQLSFEELCLTTHINKETMLELIQHDIAIPISLPIAGDQPQQWRFHLTCVTKVKKAARLNRDLGMDWADLYLVLKLLDEIDQLSTENTQLKQQLARFF